MILVSTIFALTDKENNGVDSRQLPFMVGCLVWAIGMTMGLNCGYGINPARDLIPRIFTAMAGWGSDPFKYVTPIFYSLKYSCKLLYVVLPNT